MKESPARETVAGLFFCPQCIYFGSHAYLCFNMNMTTSIAYLRISDDPDDRRLGVTRQREDVNALAERLGADAPTIYEDNDVSAMKVRKADTAWAKVLRAVEREKPDYLLCYKQDRLGRRLADIEGLEELCRKHGTTVVAVEGGDVFSNPAWPMLAAVAKMESQNTSIRIRRAHEARRAKGIPAQGGLRPYGYLPDRVTPDPYEVAVLQDVASRIIGGESTRSVLADLNTRGIKSVTGARWSSTTLKQILRNPRYIGKLARIDETRKGHTIIGDGAWEPIFDEGTWLALQAALDDRNNNVKGGRNKKPTLLGGIARCSECQRPMYHSQGGSKPRVHHYYRCAVSVGGCGKVYRDSEDLDRYVMEYLAEHVDLLDLKAERAEAEAVAERLNRQRWQLKVRRDEAVTAYREGRAGVSALDAADAIALDLQVVERQLSAALLAAERAGRAGWEDGPLEARRQWVRAHVDAVWCLPCPPRSQFDPRLIHIDLHRASVSG